MRKEGEIAMPILAAAMALGISRDNLDSLQTRGLDLRVRVKDHVAVFSLDEQVAPWKKDLWQEMIASLDRGRSSLTKTKSTYMALYLILNSYASGQSGFASEMPIPELNTNPKLSSLRDFLYSGGQMTGEDLNLLHLNLWLLWLQMPEGTRQELARSSPELVMNSTL